MAAKLSNRELRFVADYAKTGSALGAAERAGYKGRARGTQLLRKPAVRSAVEARRLAMENLAEAAPDVVNILVARLTGQTDKFGRTYENPTHAEFSKMVTPYLKTLQEAGLDLAELNPDEMTADQLQNLLPVLHREVQRLEESIADRARIIEGEVLETAPENDEDDSDDEDVFS